MSGDSSREHILVLGLGLSGLAAADLAVQQGACVTVLDTGEGPQLEERAQSLANRGVEVRLEWNEAAWDAPVDLAIVSPGIAPDSLLGRLCESFTCPVISELEYGFRHCSCPILAVTGTNGKTTTVELVTHLLKHAGLAVMAAGNIGKALSEAAARSSELDFLVVEVSSFQLERVRTFAPLAAAVLNVTPDHLDRYDSFDEYFETKLRLFEHVDSSRRVVLREDLWELEHVRRMVSRGAEVEDPITFTSRDSLFSEYSLSLDGALCWRSPDGVVRLVERNQLKLHGLHNVENALAALAVCQAAGLSPADLVPYLKTFVPTPHRLELVDVHDGVRFVNDSKATNMDAMRRAIRTCEEEAPGRILLLAGGLDKDADFAPLVPLLEKHVAEVFLIGRCRERLAKQWGHVVSCKMFVSLAAAVNAAVDSASPGDTILLSPGCASQDMFADYAERGREFCNLVKRRIGE